MDLLPYSLMQGLSQSLLTWLISLVSLLRGSPSFTFQGWNYKWDTTLTRIYVGFKDLNSGPDEN